LKKFVQFAFEEEWAIGVAEIWVIGAAYG